MNKGLYLKRLTLLFICITLAFSFDTTFATTNTPVEFISISAANSFSVAIAKDGTLWSWGENNEGQLGDGTHINRSTPQKIAGISDIIKVECGEYHVIALKKDGTVWTWGKNSYGQLGNNGTTRNRNKPVMLKGLKNIVSVAGGCAHSLALSKDGTLWGWGRNCEGQLASDEFDSTDCPIVIKNLPKISYIASKYEYTMAISNDSKVYAWGENYGTYKDSYKPINIPYFKDVVQVGTLRSEATFLLKDGTVWRLFLNPYDYKYKVDQIQNLSDMKMISAGSGHLVALKKDGTVWTYGDMSTTYCIQVKGANASTSAQEVDGINEAVFIGAGSQFCFAIDKNYKLFAWGNNCFSQLGLGTIIQSNKPSQINSLSNISKIKSSGSYCIAINNKGVLWEWGELEIKEFLKVTSLPIKKLGLSDVTSGCCADYNALAFNTKGDLWVWGANIGDDYTPKHLNFKQNPVIDACDYQIEVFNLLRSDGTVWSLNSSHGMDGLSKIEGLPQIIKLTPNNFCNLALAKDGTVWTWDDNGFYGLVEDGVMDKTEIPRKIQGLSNIVSIANGNDFVIALKKDGTVWALGKNTYGQLGDGTQKNSTKPVKVKNLSNVTAIHGGGDHCIALKKDGTVWTWGNNSNGQLGNGTYSNTKTPVKVSGLKNIKSIAAGTSHSLALDSKGNVFSWGANYTGQLGNGAMTFVQKPTIVDVTK